MKINLDDVSGLPDALKALVSENEGKHELDLSQLAPASEVERFKAKHLAASEEAIERRKALNAWKDLGESPEAVRAAMDGKTDNAQHEAIVAKIRDEAAKEKQGLQAALDGLRRDTANAALKAELAKANVVPEGLDLLAGFAGSRIQFGEDGQPRVMAADGKTPMVGSAPNGGATFADLAKELAASIPHLVKDGGTGGGGKPPASGGKPDSKTVSRSQFDAMSQVDRANFSKSGGKVVDG